LKVIFFAFDAFGQWCEHNWSKMKWRIKVRIEWRPRIEGKKVLVRPSQAEMTKGKEVVIGEERPLRMIKPKSPKDGQRQKE
jgi:hypothetical protein